MKKAVIYSLFTILAFSLSGCATTGEMQGKTAADVRHFIQVIEPTIRPTAKMICTMTINLAVNEADRAEVRAAVFRIGTVIANSNGQDPAAFEVMITAQLPEKYKSLAPAIGGIYALAFPYIKGDPQLLLKVVGDLAAGCADSTKA